MAERLVRTNTRLAISLVFVFALILGAVAGSYALSLSAIGRSQHQWCETLTLLTAQPVPKPADPEKNPSRARDYRFYVGLVDLKRRFGC